MKRLIKILKIGSISLLSLLLLLVIVYFLGPIPPKPHFNKPNFTAAASLTELEASISTSEQAIPNLKSENAAQIIWADSLKKGKTKIAFLYLHGFGASHKEGSPVDENIAKTFGCNMFLARLAEHGKDDGDANLLNFNAEDYYQSAEKALHIAQQLGDSVVIIGTSGGGAMGLFLTSRHPEIKGLITYSPAVRLFRKDAQLMAGPWGLEIAHFVTGKLHNEWNFKHPRQKLFWTNHQRFEGIVQFATFQKYTMIPETFNQVKCPFFMGYYYENEEKQDNTVSVAAMKEMYTQLSTPQYQKREICFPNTHSHVITSDLTSDDWKSVEAESAKFIQEILGMKPILIIKN
jgi:esterase/lipase